MPVPEGEQTRLMHPALATRLTGDKPYYMTGGLIPHLTKKGHFWKSSCPATHMAVLKYRLYIDPVQSANLETVEQIDCGWMAPLRKMALLPRRHHWPSLHCWGTAPFSHSPNISSTCLCETPAVGFCGGPGVMPLFH